MTNLNSKDLQKLVNCHIESDTEESARSLADAAVNALPELIAMAGRVEELEAAIRKMDLEGEVGLCTLSRSGVNECLKRVRDFAYSVGIQGGVTPSRAARAQS